jgi:hypothetical protein
VVSATGPHGRPFNVDAEYFVLVMKGEYKANFALGL